MPSKAGEEMELVERLREACNGHPHAKIAWPHRILHEAADTISRLVQERDAFQEKAIVGEYMWTPAEMAEVVADRDAARQVYLTLQQAETKLVAKLEEMRRALEGLVTQLDTVADDGRYKAVWLSYHVHGGVYSGPTYTEELAAARKALEQS